ncbi:MULTISPECIES: hypothetical protein [Enterococcus]|uniref:Transposase n=1 Tax=Candidatus Enterococcus ferrettii TaxID=2815324 RepID=A0ABV0EWW7_9ENTE|nr:hypothetical protein [Enterococcus sp. 665A]MBO1338740.1 hypothetical protein [Enterococcus sp. 665A]
MKLHEIRKEYGLNQTTFYGWLRELGAIRKADTGYVVGDNHFDGMENLVTRRVNENGEFIERTQVKIDNQKIPYLLEKYKQSGLPKLYSPTKMAETSVGLEELSALETRVAVLENQLFVLTQQMQLLLKK